MSSKTYYVLVHTGQDNVEILDVSEDLKEIQIAHKKVACSRVWQDHMDDAIAEYSLYHHVTCIRKR